MILAISDNQTSMHKAEGLLGTIDFLNHPGNVACCKGPGIMRSGATS